MTLAEDLRLLGEIWHRTFGKVKCWSKCYICRDTDWPDAQWVRR